MSTFAQDLMEGETIVQRAHVSRIIYVPALLVAVLAAGATGFLLSQGADAGEAARFVGPLLGLGALYLALSAWVRRGSARFAVTNKRVFIRYGLVRQRSTEILLSQVEGIAVTQGFFARMFNYGTVVIEGTGGDAEPYLRIAAPLAFRRTVQEQIELYNQRGPAPTPGASAAAAAATGAPDRYGELLKLDGLKAKGILTEDEFQREKRRILQG
jgi:membrane protein YdbS with pleckstrin-like domain